MQPRSRDEEKLDTLINNGAGVKKLKQFREGQTGTSRITSVRNKDGAAQTDPESICEVFAQFYEDLYKETDVLQHPTLEDTVAEVRVTHGEVEAALKRLKNMKTGADDGLVAEMLKTRHTGLVEAIALFFTDIPNGDRLPPTTWKATKLKVLFKKGDAELPKNYRPISVIPVLAKLYSIVLYERIRDLVEDRLAEEQFGFRRGRGCTDAVHILRTVVEKSAEWGEPLFMAALDVEKAFDRVHHADLFAALSAVLEPAWSQH